MTSEHVGSTSGLPTTHQPRPRHYGRELGQNIDVPGGRSRQQSYANLTSVEVYVSVSSTLKHQRCRNPCFLKFLSLHPICKIEVHLRPECFLAIREYASYYCLPLWRTVVRQYIELETLPYLNFRLHLNSLYVLSFRSLMHRVVSGITVFGGARPLP